LSNCFSSGSAGVGDDHLVALEARNRSIAGPERIGVRRGDDDAPAALGHERVGRLGDRPAGVDHVVDQDAHPAGDVTDDRLATLSLGRVMSRVLWTNASGAPPSRADHCSATLIRPASGETTASFFVPYFSMT
jgi:hypothetical protein